MIQYLYNLFSECFRKKDEPKKYTGHVDVIYK